MRITVGVTDLAWAAYLRARRDLFEVNFWVPSARSFMGRGRPSEPFLFKTKRGHNQLVGGGFFVHFWELRVSEAWAVFGEGNGCASERLLSEAIKLYRARNHAPWEPDPSIGCLVLRNPFFAEAGDEMPQPPHWGRSIVQGKTYDENDVDFDYVQHAFRAFQGAARVDLAWDRDLAGVDLEDAERYGAPVLTRHRLGQGSFRLTVLESYGGRCAVTGSSATPALEAAHIRDYAQGGPHRISNGLALRSDLHRLYDRGYLGVDTAFRVRVSPRLRTDFGNGVDLYEREAKRELIRLPERDVDRPDLEALQWHMDEVFLSSA